MSCRKKLKNQDTFLFEEDDVLPAPSVSALQKKRSVQERLTPKAGFPPRPRTSTAGNSATSSWRQVEPPALNNNYCYQPPPPPQPSTAPSTSQPSPDPALDRIVAKLRAELALSEPGARQAAAGGAGGVGCLCERPTKLVLCQLCGATYPGRIALTCSSHPRKLFLQDLNRCRDCQAGNLDNLKEFELPPGMKETLGKIRKF